MLLEPVRWEKENFAVSTDPKMLDVESIHAFLSRSYWAEGIPLSVVRKSVQNSLGFGLYLSDEGRFRQIGFARVVSDYATFAYLGDVYVLEEYRGKGLSKWLMDCVVAHPQLQGLRRFCLGTKDAHGLYMRYGFEVIKAPENWMEIKKPNLYKR
ncbi:MAG: GNAT family N-acetyltransferase [Bdellovibrionales bacterium]|nr:GNAT family N-acetyltransferase [Bdellovibrionales bacterium]